MKPDLTVPFKIKYFPHHLIISGNDRSFSFDPEGLFERNFTCSGSQG